MWIIRWLVAVPIILIILGFALQNTTQEVSVVFIRGKVETGPLPIWLIVYVSFALGVIFWLFVSIFQVLALKMEMRKLRAENARIHKELDNLRNLSVDADLGEAPQVEALPPAKETPEEARPAGQGNQIT